MTTQKETGPEGPAPGTSATTDRQILHGVNGYRGPVWSEDDYPPPPELAGPPPLDSNGHRRMEAELARIEAETPTCIVCGRPATWQSPTGHWACEDCKRAANEPQGSPGPLPLLTLAELCAKVDAAGPRKYLIRGIWPSGAYGVLAGEMKAQKTWKAVDLAVSVASGTPWLGNYPIDDPGPVVGFFGEGGEGSIVRRIRAVCEGRGIRAEDLPIIVCVRAPHLSRTDHMEVFAEQVQRIRPKLVTLDPLYLAAAGAKGSDLYGMGELLERGQLICDDVDASFLVVTHFNRGSRTGAGRITGAGPAEWGRVLIGVDVKSRHTDPETRATTVVSVVDVMGGEVPDSAFRIKRTISAADPDDLGSPLRYSVEVLPEDGVDSADGDMPPARRKLIEAVYAIGGEIGATGRELVDWIAGKYGHGLYRTTVSGELNKALKDGLVDCVESPGQPTVWMVPRVSPGVVTTPRRHPPTGDPVGVSSPSSLIRDDDTPTPPNGTLEVSPSKGSLLLDLDAITDAEIERIAGVRR